MTKPRRLTPPSPTSPSLDRFALYELCVQSPDYDAKMLRAIHGRSPATLGEDFCGSAAISRAWVALSPKSTAIAVDHDEATLAAAQARDPGLKHKKLAGRITYILADVLAVRDRCDIITVQNFSICELHTRPSLVKYLRHARSRLAPRGLFACDIYAGADCFFTGRIKRIVEGPNGERITYTWEHRTTDPLRARVQNAIHFEVRGGSAGRKPQRLTDAFVYDWRLWSPPELAEAMLEAGFSQVQFYPRFAEAIDDDDRYHVLPIEDSNELSDSFSVYVVTRR
jgi:SAM-dependent methyltransferase